MKTKEEYQDFIKTIFEALYEKLCNQDESFVKMPHVPEEMWADDVATNEEWKKWKLTSSTVTDKDIDELEKELGVSFPVVFRAFLSTYFHYFDDEIGRSSPDDAFKSVRQAWNPILVKFGYLPFGWDSNGAYLRCIDLENMPDEEMCAIYEIDHEILFNFDEETVTEDDIDENMLYVAENFMEFLKDLLEEPVVRFLKQIEAEYIKEEAEIETDDIPTKMQDFYKVVQSAKLGYGEIYDYHTAKEKSKELPFGVEWFVFGEGENNTYWLCSREDEEESFTYCKKNDSKVGNEEKYEELQEFLEEI